MRRGQLLRQRGDHIRPGHTRRDGIDPDPRRTKFPRKAFRQTVDGEFTCRIPNAAGLSVQADH